MSILNVFKLYKVVGLLEVLTQAWSEFYLVCAFMTRTQIGPAQPAENCVKRFVLRSALGWNIIGNYGFDASWMRCIPIVLESNERIIIKKEIKSMEWAWEISQNWLLNFPWALRKSWPSFPAFILFSKSLSNFFSGRILILHHSKKKRQKNPHTSIYAYDHVQAYRYGIWLVPPFCFYLFIFSFTNKKNNFTNKKIFLF